MQWNEFVSNVRQWSTERGIYEHSTATAQALKACSEAGELCDAVIKGDRAAMMDAVGDVAVCLVNAWTINDPLGMPMINDEVDDPCSVEACASFVAYYCASAANGAAMNSSSGIFWCMDDALYYLQEFCASAGLNFLQCCESSWNEIKDRKGRMVAGGAFVKE